MRVFLWEGIGINILVYRFFVLAVFNYDYLMDTDLFNALIEEFGLVNKVVYLPVVVKNHVYCGEGGEEVECFVRRVIGLRGSGFKEGDFVLELCETGVTEYFNGVIALNVFEGYFDYLKGSELAYNLCRISKSDVYPIYSNYNMLFLLQFFDMFPQERERLLGVIGKSGFSGSLKDVVSNLDQQTIKRMVYEVLPSEIYVFRSSLVDELGSFSAERLNDVKVLQLEKRLERLTEGILRSWGPWFLRDFLETTFVRECGSREFKSLTKFRDLCFLKNLEERYPLYFFDHSWMKNINISWVFTISFDKILDPIKIADNLIKKKIPWSVFYLVGTGQKVERFLKINSRADYRLSRDIVSKVSLFLSSIEEMFNPSIFSEKMFSGVYLGRFNLKVVFEDPIISSLEIPVDVYVFIFLNGILAIIYELDNVEKNLNKISLPILLSIWKEREYIRKVSLVGFVPVNLRPFSEEDLSEISRNIFLEILRASFSEHDIKELYGKYTLNHPFIYAVCENRLGKESIMSKIKNLIKKQVRGYYLSTTSLRNISPYDECAVYTDFNSLILWNKNKVSADLMFIYKNYLSLLFMYALVVRKGVTDTYYALERILYEPFSIRVSDKFKYIHEKWLKTIVLTKPERVLRSKTDVKIVKKMFNIFRIDQLLLFINRFKGELNKYIDWQMERLEKLAIIILNAILSGSLAVDIMNIAAPPIRAKTMIILMFISLWGLIGLVIYLICYILPRILCKILPKLRQR